MDITAAGVAHTIPLSFALCIALRVFVCVRGGEQVKVSTYGYVLIAANQHGFSQPSEVVSAAAAHCTAPCWPALCTLYYPVLSCPVL